MATDPNKTPTSPELDNWMTGSVFDQSKVPEGFNYQQYLSLYPDLGAAGIDTLLEAQRHYALYGAGEGRQYAQQTPNLDAIRQLYTDVLGRQADQPGLEYWGSMFGTEVSPDELEIFKQAAAPEIAARPPLSADDQLRADMANLSALANSGQLASLLYPDRTPITRDMLAYQPASGLQATGALQGGLSPTNTTSTSTLASDAYQNQLDADALARGRQRYVSEAEKILGRKLSPEEATSLGQAAYPEIQRYTDPKTGAKSYMTPYYDVGSYFRDKLTDEDKQRLDRDIDRAVIAAATKKMQGFPLSIEERQRLQNLYGYEDALTYGSDALLKGLGNPQFLAPLSESDQYNEIISGITSRQATEAQAAAERAAYDAASREGRAYNGTIYDTKEEANQAKEEANQAYLDDLTAQGRVYKGMVYLTKEDADYWRSVDAEFARITEQERLAGLARQEAAEQRVRASQEGRLFQDTIYDTPEQALAAKADYNRNYVLNDRTQRLSSFLGRQLTDEEKANVAEIVDYYAKDYQEDKSDRYRYYPSKWNPETKTWEKTFDSSKSLWEQMPNESHYIGQDAVPKEDVLRTFISLHGTKEEQDRYDAYLDKKEVDRIQEDLARKYPDLKLTQDQIDRINKADGDYNSSGVNRWNFEEDITKEYLARKNADSDWYVPVGTPFIRFKDYQFGNLTNYDPAKDGSIINYLREQNSGIDRSQQPGNTFIQVYKNVDGKLENFDPNKVTQQDLKSGNTYFVIGGEREPGHPWARHWQLYNAQGDFLKPVEGEYGQVYSTYGVEPSKGRPDWLKAIDFIAMVGLTYGIGSGLGSLAGFGSAGAGTAGATLGSEAALLAAEGLSAAELGGLATAADLGLAGAGMTAADLAAVTGSGLGSSITATLTSALPAELVEAGRTLANTFKTVRPYIQGANAVYQASQGNIAGAISSGLGAAGSFGVPGAADAAKVFNLAYGATQGNYLPVVQELMNQSGVGGTLANTKIAGDFTLADAFKGASFLQALQSENPTIILNAAASLTDSQDLKVAAAARNFVNILNNPRATAFDIAMGADRIATSLSNASKQPPPKDVSPTSGQSTVAGALGNDTVSGELGNDSIAGGDVVTPTSTPTQIGIDTASNDTDLPDITPEVALDIANRTGIDISEGLDFTKGEHVAAAPLLLIGADKIIASAVALGVHGAALYAALKKAENPGADIPWVMDYSTTIPDYANKPSKDWTQADKDAYNKDFTETIGKWESQPLFVSKDKQVEKTVSSDKVPSGFKYNDFTQSFPYIDEFQDVHFVSKEDLNTNPNLKWLEQIYFPEQVSIDTDINVAPATPTATPTAPTTPTATSTPTAPTSPTTPTSSLSPIFQEETTFDEVLNVLKPKTPTTPATPTSPTTDIFPPLTEKEIIEILTPVATPVTPTTPAAPTTPTTPITPVTPTTPTVPTEPITPVTPTVPTTPTETPTTPTETPTTPTETPTTPTTPTETPATPTTPTSTETPVTPTAPTETPATPTVPTTPATPTSPTAPTTPTTPTTPIEPTTPTAPPTTPTETPTTPTVPTAPPTTPTTPVTPATPSTPTETPTTPTTPTAPTTPATPTETPVTPTTPTETPTTPTITPVTPTETPTTPTETPVTPTVTPTTPTTPATPTAPTTPTTPATPATPSTPSTPATPATPTVTPITPTETPTTPTPTPTTPTPTETPITPVTPTPTPTPTETPTTPTPTPTTPTPTPTTPTPTIRVTPISVPTSRPTTPTEGQMTMPMAQAVAAAFGMPQLANVFYYGKEFGSKKQKLTKEGKLEEEEYQPLSVTQAGAEPEQITEQIEGKKKTEDNIVNQVLKTIDDDTVSFDDLLRILRGQ